MEEVLKRRINLSKPKPSLLKSLGWNAAGIRVIPNGISDTAAPHIALRDETNIAIAITNADQVDGLIEALRLARDEIFGSTKVVFTITNDLPDHHQFMKTRYHTGGFVGDHEPTDHEVVEDNFSGPDRNISQ